MSDSNNSWREHNRAAWDRRVDRGAWYIDTATDEDFLQPLKVADPLGWLGDVVGKRILCLAAGGGRHGPLLATAGAHVTVVDLSPRMLALDRQVATARGLALRLVEASMDDLSALGDATFDGVIQPVSTCYLPDVAKVYREVARVLAPGGVYVSQHKQPVSLQTSDGPQGSRGLFVINEPYYREGPLPPAGANCLHREAGTAEHLHRLEQLVGGLCRSGFVIEDLVEPRHTEPGARPGTFAHRCSFVPPYLALRARRKDSDRPASPAGLLILP